MTNDLKNIYPRQHVEFIVREASGAARTEIFEFVVEPGANAWEVIRARQDEILAGGALGANTCNYRTLLDRDGYRD